MARAKVACDELGKRQLPRKRRPLKKRSSIQVDGISLCGECASFDVGRAIAETDAFFSANWDLVLGLRRWKHPRKKFEGLKVADLSISGRSKGTCDLCRFFWSSRLERSSSGSYVLLAFPSYWALPVDLDCKAFPKESRTLQPSLWVVAPAEIRYPALLDSFAQPNCIFHEVPNPGDALSARRSSQLANVTLVKEWLAFCDRHHGADCPKPADSRGRLQTLPGFRLIDCETQRLVDWEPHRDYVALSYVWGAQGWHGASAWPPVVTDAAALTKQLGLRYLWVDRYCIDQDNEQQKHSQIAHMNIIYQSAQATIVAAAGDTAADPLPGVSRPRPPLRHIAPRGFHLFAGPEDAPGAIRASTWWSRGWTYQEGVLSRRRIVLTPQQIYYECGGMVCYEGLRISLTSPLPAGGGGGSSGTSSLQHSPILPGIFNDDPLRQSRQARFSFLSHSHVLKERLFYHGRNYSHRQLTYEYDALNAFRGVLGHLGLRTFFALPAVNGANSVYVDGQGISSALLAGSKLGYRETEFRKSLVSWWHAWRRRPASPAGKGGKKSKKGRVKKEEGEEEDEKLSLSALSVPPTTPQRLPSFPSWSWVGWRGAIQYQSDFRHAGHARPWPAVHFRFLPAGVPSLPSQWAEWAYPQKVAYTKTCDEDLSSVLTGEVVLSLECSLDLRDAQFSVARDAGEWDNWFAVSWRLFRADRGTGRQAMLHFKMSVDVDEDGLSELLLGGRVIVAFVVGSSDEFWFVVLQAVDGKGEGEDEERYERIGVCHTSRWNLTLEQICLWVPFSERKICII